MVNRIYTLDASMVVDYGVIKKNSENEDKYHYEFSIDFSNPVIKNVVIRDEEDFSDNAFFFQIRDSIKALGKEKKIAENINRHILFMDFANCSLGYSGKELYSDSELAGVQDNYKAKALLGGFDNGGVCGLTIKFDDNNSIKFVPFDKSASMSRQNRISFIDESLKADLDDRLMLGMKLENVKLSKYSAYRGLYMTNSVRMPKNSDELVLNEETVIVLKENKIQPAKQTVFTYDFEKKDYVSDDNFQMSFDPFDGEGLISPDYAKELNGHLPFLYKGSTSFQIRMPFCKGVVHTADFNQFFSDENICEKYKELFNNVIPVSIEDKLIVTDCFGIERDLREAKILITESMFKCKGWIEALFDKPNKENDPMKYYFEKFEKYNHSLYIANTDSLYSQSGRINLNYQLLSPLKMEKEDFKAMLNESAAEYIDKYEDEFVGDSVKSAAGQILSDDYEGFGESDFSNLNNMQMAVALNKNFLYDEKIRNMVKDGKKARIADYAIGRVIVDGEMLMLSRDLMAFLVEVFRNTKKYSENKEIRDAWERFDHDLIPDEKFFSPRINHNYENNKRFALFRNPHLSRNEECILSSFNPTEIQSEQNALSQYFGNLRGVLMIPLTSLANATLGGADFDGDIIKITPNEKIVNAVISGVYIVDDNNQITGRSLPIVVIPSKTENESKINQKNIYHNIENTFSNNVGVISNTAVRLSKYEYVENPEDKFIDSCAKCTIVTGLEIDAAKTGEHPTEQICELRELAGAKDYYLNLLEKIEKIKSSDVKLDKDNMSIIVRENDAYIKTEYRIDIARDGKRNIDYLPEFCFDTFNMQNEKGKGERKQKKSNYKLFDFPKDDVTLDDDKKAKMISLIKGYKAVCSEASKLYKMRMSGIKKSYAAKLINQLNKQYDNGLEDIVPNTFYSVNVALDNSVKFLMEIENDGDKTEYFSKAIKRLTEEKGVQRWANSESLAEAYDKLDRILPGVSVPDEMLMLITNFDNDILNIFELLLINVRNMCKTEKNSKMRIYDTDDNYCRRMKEIYNSSCAGKVWKNDLKYFCREELMKLFDEDMTKALMYSFLLRKDFDKSGAFFWDIFNSEEISKTVYIAPDNINTEGSDLDA